MNRNRVQQPCGWIVVAASILLAGCHAMKDYEPAADWPLARNPHPWTILAMSFSDVPHSAMNPPVVPPEVEGRDRQARAENLVRYLRKKEYLEAYYAHKTGPKKNWSAVLVGGYDKPDSYAAQGDLSRTKKAIDRLFGKTSGAGTRLDRYMEQRPVHRPRVMMVANSEVADPGGRRRATEAAPPAFNKGPYNIYTCPGRYTLRVKALGGARVFWFAGQRPPKVPSMLREAESVSEYLAEHLRKQGHQAYTWHSRRASAVCVGSFDHPKDPQIERVRQQFSKMRVPIKRDGRDGVIAFDDRPGLLTVPKR